jgi:trk system potassium uptake protein TrkH
LARVITLPMRLGRPGMVDPASSAKIFATALIVMVLIGTILLSVPWATEDGTRTPLVDAFFTSVSAGAVTGLVTVDTQSHWSLFGELVILALIQAGGLGFMIGAALILQFLRSGQTSLRDEILIREGGAAISLREATHTTARIVRFTVIVEAACAALLAARFARDMPVHEAIYYGLFHSISAFCNAGFDLFGNFGSIAEYQSSLWVSGVLMILIQAGALSYLVFADLGAKRRWVSLSLDTKLVLVVNAFLLAAGAVSFLVAEWNASLAPVPETARPLAALFQSVSARTAGYASVNFADAHALTLFVWVAIMMVGGASGSTAGGVKLATLGVVMAAVVSTVRGRSEATAFGRRIETLVIYRAMAIIALFMLVHFLVTAALGISEDLFGGRDSSFIALMFEAMSAMATVGLTTGITPTMTTAGKLILCVAMLFGRLGPLTAAYALQRRQARVAYRLPVAPVRIG